MYIYFHCNTCCNAHIHRLSVSTHTEATIVLLLWIKMAACRLWHAVSTKQCAMTVTTQYRIIIHTVARMQLCFPPSYGYAMDGASEIPTNLQSALHTNNNDKEKNRSTSIMPIKRPPFAKLSSSDFSGN